MKIKTNIHLIIAIIGLLLFHSCSDTEQINHEGIQNTTEQIYDSLVEIRRDFHKHPELSGQESRTSKKIENYLLSIGLDVKTGIGGYGVVGILNGSASGKKLAWRADIDALKTHLPDVVEFKSKNPGVRHICGHDVHATIGLGIAHVLSEMKENIDGTVYFIFQPSEENFKGAKAMIEDGLFEIISPDEIYGLHIYKMPVGTISTKPNEVFSYNRVIKIRYNNTDSQDSIINYTQSALQSLSTIGQELWNKNNLTNPQIGTLSPTTLFDDYLVVDKRFRINRSEKEVIMSVRYAGTNENAVDSFPKRFENMVKQSKYAQNLISVDVISKSPTVINDPGLTRKTVSSITSIYGEDVFNPSYGIINGFNDDFSFFQEKVDGVYYLLGASNSEKGLISMPHSPDFAVDERCISYGVKYFSSMIMERLKDQ
jgi:amidohydrolase